MAQKNQNHFFMVKNDVLKLIFTKNDIFSPLTCRLELKISLKQLHLHEEHNKNVQWLRGEIFSTTEAKAYFFIDEFRKQLQSFE